MAIMRHARSGALYSLQPDGTVEVENNNAKGRFSAYGVYLSGEIKQADPHLILWIAGPQLPIDAQVRTNR